MAKRKTLPTITGTFGNVTIYKMRGQLIARAKSSLTRKRVLKSKAFAKTRQYASNMGLASQIASAVYRELPSNKKDRKLYQTITGEAASMLYNGTKEEKVKAELRKKYI